MVEDNDEKFSMSDLYQYLRDHEIEVINDKVVHVNDDLAIIGEGDSGFQSQENNGFFTAYTKIVNSNFVLNMIPVCEKKIQTTELTYR